MNATTRSQAEQSAGLEEDGLAWVGMQWRMDGYCGRVDGNRQQQQCGNGDAGETADPQSHPQQPVTSDVEAEQLSFALPLSRRNRPLRRGPGQQQQAA